jgi:AbrB family looped-hinge helix DNA binding protein
VKKVTQSFRADSRNLRKAHLVGLPGGRLLKEHEPGAKGFRHYKVSSVGQLTLPAAVRQRWGIHGGGRVEVADLGFGVVIVPDGGAAVLLGDWLSPAVQQELDSRTSSMLAASWGRRRAFRQ